MKIKPQNTKGTRDFLPQEVAKRNFIFDTIKKVFRKYGFQEIETPAFESLDTLTSKYGTEGEKLLFKIRSNKNLLERLSPNLVSSLQAEYPCNFVPSASDKGLRYDLTVPLARYVVQHQNDLVFPFKRFHIGPVWRADRPQKGRYQEFFQCDADVIGSSSLLNEVELTQIYLEVFQNLKLDVTIKINHRKILSGIATYFGCTDRYGEFLTVLDKVDKIGISGVVKEFVEKGFTKGTNESLLDEIELSYLTTQLQGSGQTLSKQLEELSFRLGSTKALSGLAISGIDELRTVISHFEGQNTNVKIDVLLTRGLDYYTGVIWEVISKDIPIGSIASGGRYDNLTEMFGGQNMSGVGISFGIERIYDVMEELQLFPAELTAASKILFVHFSEANRDYAFNIVQQLRAANISAEVYPDVSKIDKQMKYANNKQIPFVALVGDNEMNSQCVMLKNMQTGEQHKVGATELPALLG